MSRIDAGAGGVFRADLAARNTQLRPDGAGAGIALEDEAVVVSISRGAPAGHADAWRGHGEKSP